MNWQDEFLTASRFLPLTGLVALRNAIEEGSPELIRHEWCEADAQGQPCRACAYGYAMWKGRNVSVAQICGYCATLNAEFSGSFIKWWDEEASDFRDLLPVLDTIIEGRS